MILKSIFKREPNLLNSDAWCNMIFEKRNKLYGAYEMRKSAGRRYLLSFILTILLCLFALLMIIGVNKLIATDREIKRQASSSGSEYPSMIIFNEEESEEDLSIYFNRNIKIAEEAVETKGSKRITLEKKSEDDIQNNIEEKEELIEDVFFQEIECIDDQSQSIELPDGAIYCDIIPKLEQQIDLIEEVVEDIYQCVSCPSNEQLAQFPGGMEELTNYLNNNLCRYIEDIQEERKKRVVVRFTVTAKGNVEQVTVLKSLSPACDRDVIRVLTSMPKWFPAKREGQPIAIQFVLPICYILK